MLRSREAKEFFNPGILPTMTLGIRQPTSETGEQVVATSCLGPAAPDRKSAATFASNSNTLLDFFRCRQEKERGRSPIAWREAVIPFFSWIVRCSSNCRTLLYDRIPWHLVRTGCHCSPGSRGKKTPRHQPHLPAGVYPKAQQHRSIHDSQAKSQDSCGDSVPIFAATIQSVTNHTRARLEQSGLCSPGK